MRPLRPVTILVAGPLLVGVAFLIVAALVGRNEWTVRSSLICFVCGASLGALILAPIGLVEAFHIMLTRLVGPYSRYIEWYASLSMAVACGYCLRAMRQGAFDGSDFLAMAVFMIGAMIQMAMEILSRYTGHSI